jgi:AcrR family transcriptional regulator
MPRVPDRRAKIELLRAAEAAFAEHGLSGAKVEDITARAGVSKGAFYLHFESKEDCFRQIVEGVLARLSSRIVQADAQVLATPEDVLERLAMTHAHDVEMFEFCWQNRALLRMILGGGGGAPYAYLTDTFGQQIIHHSETWIRRAIAAGLYRDDIEPGILARLVSGAYERLVRELIKQPRRPDIAAWARQLQALLTRGIFTRDVRAILDRKVTTAPRAR